MALFSLLFVFFSSLVTQLPGELFRSWFSCVYVINQNFNARLNLNNCMIEFSAPIWRSFSHMFYCLAVNLSDFKINALLKAHFESVVITHTAYLKCSSFYKMVIKLSGAQFI